MRKFMLMLVVVTSLSGCASAGDYQNSGAPAGYYYSDPSACSHGPACAVILGAMIGGLAAVLAH